jgi:hypothetical protein
MPRALLITLFSCLLALPASAGLNEQHGSAPPVVHPAAPPPHPAAKVPHPAPVPVPQKITANPALLARVQPLVPSGLTVSAAASGFKNQGQFIAALHVSRNLNIPFAQLKAEMTGADHDSLGQAIHELRPAANVKTALATARQEARADIKATTPKPDADTDKDGK